MHPPGSASALPALVALGAALSVSCADEGRSKKLYEFVIRVEGDPGRPLAGVALSHAGERLGASDARGVIAFAAHGREGETLAFEVRCPDGHRAPSRPLSIVLRRLAEPGKRPEYNVSCPPLKRTLVVAVRADNGPNLPVRHLGRELARTDSSGAAHVLLEAQEEDAFELVLDTSDQIGLRPTNPSARFVVTGKDELVSFNHAFEPAKAKPSFQKRAPRGPRRIGSD